MHCCCCLITGSSLTLCNPMVCSPPGSSVHGISQARIMDTISISRGSSQPKNWTHISCIRRWILYHWITREVPVKGIVQCVWRKVCPDVTNTSLKRQNTSITPEISLYHFLVNSPLPTPPLLFNTILISITLASISPAPALNLVPGRQLKKRFKSTKWIMS